MLLEPADMADFPERRIDDVELGAEQPLALERVRDAREVVAARDEI